MALDLNEVLPTWACCDRSTGGKLILNSHWPRGVAKSQPANWPSEDSEGAKWWGQLQSIYRVSSQRAIVLAARERGRKRSVQERHSRWCPMGDRLRYQTEPKLSKALLAPTTPLASAANSRFGCRLQSSRGAIMIIMVLIKHYKRSTTTATSLACQN